MKKTEKEFYVILKKDEETVQEFVSSVTHVLDQYKENNLVIDLLEEQELTLDQLLDFLPVSDKHREKNRSFVVASNTLNIDEIPEELLVVPSLQEAEDLIQMEEIERDLGF